MTMKPGDRVLVTPANPLAIGRGAGTVHKIGDRGFLVLVKFPHIHGAGPQGSVSCLLSDCRKEPTR
jgi:hypothetical protein